VSQAILFPTPLKDRYRIKALIGSGGFAAVYLALDSELHDQQVVIKILHENQSAPEWVEKKFCLECEALSRLGHPGIVGVRDRGSTPDGRQFLVLEFINGATLRSLIAKTSGGMDLCRAAAIVRQIAQALSAAHDAGVHHRDLKPENIMIRDLGDGQEQPVIIDFGIATVLGSKSSGAMETRVAGSLRYMSPEQLAGKPEAASDIYALGVIAFEMVTGCVPFPASSAVELHRQQERGPEQGPCTLRPDLPPGAGAAILKALSFDASARHTRAGEFGAEFENAILLHGPESKPPCHRAQTRMLDVGMQRQVPIYIPAELVALIRRAESEGLRAIIETDSDFSITEQDVRSRPIEIEFPRDHAGHVQPLELTLSVDSPDFEPKQQSKTISVPPDRDSDAYTFLVVPQHLGESRLTVEVRSGAVYIASRMLKTYVETSERITVPAPRTLVSIPIQVFVDLSMPTWVREWGRLGGAAPSDLTAESSSGSGELAALSAKEIGILGPPETTLLSGATRKGPRESTTKVLGRVRSTANLKRVGIEDAGASRNAPVRARPRAPFHRRPLAMVPFALTAVLLGSYALFTTRLLRVAPLSLTPPAAPKAELEFPRANSYSLRRAPPRREAEETEAHERSAAATPDAIQRLTPPVAPKAKLPRPLPRREAEETEAHERSAAVTPDGAIQRPAAFDIAWRGRLAPGDRLTIRGSTCSSGTLVDGSLPAEPVLVTNILSGVTVEHLPSAHNGFRLRLRNNTSVPVTELRFSYRATAR